MKGERATESGGRGREKIVKFFKKYGANSTPDKVTEKVNECVIEDWQPSLTLKS